MIALRLLEEIPEGFEAEGPRLRDRSSRSGSFGVVHGSENRPLKRLLPSRGEDALLHVFRV